MFTKSLTGGIMLAICVIYAALSSQVMAQEATDWTGRTGRWNEAAKWSNGLPTAFKKASIKGDGSLVIPTGNYITARLDVGVSRGDHAKVQLDGGQLLIRQESLIIGEHTGSEGTFVLNSGSLQSVMDVFVGGPTGSTGRMNRSSLILRGGEFIGLTLTVGEGFGAESTVSIEGSRATSISVLEFVSFLANADPIGQPGESSLSFTLDEHGVTPIVIQSRWKGLLIQHDSVSHCRLRIALSSTPPRDDVPLVVSKVPIQGAFDGFPEGSKISAEYAGRTYSWIVTYVGGTSGHDLVLHNISTYAPNAPISHVNPLPEPPFPSWWAHPVYPLAIPAGRPAFPCAEGYGAYTVGGRGGRNIYVDNLEDSGPGSLRAAVEATGPRIVAFRVGGTIQLKSPLIIENPFVTLDGSNAPIPGILLRRHGIEVHTHDVILRQFRIRIGDEDVRRNDKNIRYDAGDGEYALDFTDGSSNSIADHLSLSWSTNKILSTTLFSDRITVQWCILSESLNIDGHGYSSITSGNRVTWDHNLFAHNNSRNVRFQGAVDADFRNNVIYDWGITAGYGEFDRVNYVGNYLKPGPSTVQSPPLFLTGEEAIAPHSLYLSGNILEGSQKATEDNWKGTRYFYDRANFAAAEPFAAPPTSIESAEVAYVHVLSESGATEPVRDAVDQRIVNEVRTGTGHLIESVEEIGGWPKF
jgi:hypothetical protein